MVRKTLHFCIIISNKRDSVFFMDAKIHLNYTKNKTLFKRCLKRALKSTNKKQTNNLTQQNNQSKKNVGQNRN